MAKKNKKTKKQKKDSKKKESKEITKQNLYIMWVLVFMIVLIVSFVGFSYYRENYVNHFDYIGLRFTKTRLGEIPLYAASIPIDRKGQIIGTYNINLMNDPRELENVKLELHDDRLSFYRQFPVYITIAAEIEPCQLTWGSIASLSEFLEKFAMLNVKPGISNETHANETGFDYITCENKPDNTVLSISSGNETRITKIGSNCYEMVFTNCEINQLTERFVVEIIDRYMQHFNEKMEEQKTLENLENNDGVENNGEV